MTPRDLGRLYFDKARDDENALRALAGNPEISDAIVGFHAQQAAEKYMKAVLAVEQVKPERTHDLGVLLDELRELSYGVPEQFLEMQNWTPYAVAERYPFVGASRSLDRDAVVALTQQLREWVESIT